MRDHVFLAARHLASDLLPEGLHTRLGRWLAGGLLDRVTRIKRVSSHEKYRGAWDGNDTCWRMAADLYKVFIKDESGWRSREGRSIRTFSVVDGITGGEENGPFSPLARDCRLVLGGEDLLDVDCVAARLMDFDPAEIRYIVRLLQEEGRSLPSIQVACGAYRPDGFFDADRRYLDFVPPTGWPRLALHRRGEGAAEGAAAKAA
jgi:hypothetical protein